MKYFTRECVLGELDDVEFDDRLVQYLRYRDSVWDLLPVNLRKAIDSVPFHDAKVARLYVREAEREIELELLVRSVR